MEENREVFILLKDKAGERSSNVLVGTLFGSTPCNVLRGELAVKIPEKARKDGQPPYNHQTVFSDHPATFYDGIEESEVAPLLGDQHLLLAGVKSLDERHKIFVSGRLDWGASLKINDAVQVSLNKLQATDTEATPKATAVIQYVGPVKGEAGLKFGIDIVDPHFQGQGTTDGTFQGERHFTCKDGNGMFVSLDKLSKLPPGGHVPDLPPKQKNGGKTKDKKKERKYRFKAKDRVVAFNKDGIAIHGTVKWVGMYELVDEKGRPYSLPAVGIETDVKVQGSEMESCLPSKHHLFTIGKKKGGTLFMREEEVLLEEDFANARTQEPPTSTQPHKSHLYHMRERPEAQLPEEEEYRGQDESLNVHDPNRLAQQMGAGSSTQLLKEQSELLQKAAKEKEKELRHELGGALQVDESLNLQGQERLIHQFKEEKKKGDMRRNSETQPPKRDVNHIYDTVPNVPSVPRRPLHPPNHPSGQSQEPPQYPSNQPAVQHPAHYSAGKEPPPVQHHPPHKPPPDSDYTNVDPYTNQVIQHPQASHSQPPPPVAASSTMNTQQPLGHNWAYAGQPSQTSAALGIGSPVQVGDNTNLTGVIKWTGTLPDAKGAVAGVELDAPMDGCTDGMWRGIRHFTCAQGRGFFCPVTTLRPDSRIPQLSIPSHTDPSANPLQVPEWENQDQHIAGNQIVKYIGDERGIQGHQNSCYLDATIFGLFALSDVFDSLFLDNAALTSLQISIPVGPAQQVQREISSMLWKGIVNPLRQNGAVRYDSVMRLREKLDELGKMEGVKTSEKDPEEFLNMLFKHTLHVEPFIHIKRPFGVEPEFFVQLFVEFDESLKVPTIQNLLEKMCTEQQISFTEVPSKLLVQVPRYGKQYQTYKRIVPGIKFDPAPLIDTPYKCFICGESARKDCKECKDEFKEDGESVHFCHGCCELAHKNMRRSHKTKICQEQEDALAKGELELLSVLCIETSHYVCFSRDSEGRWLFFDSMANRVFDQYNIPRGVDCTDQLREWVYEGDQERLMAVGPRELPELVRRFTQDVYMCVYIQPDYGMYG